jgi:hypothetical protein
MRFPDLRRFEDMSVGIDGTQHVWPPPVTSQLRDAYPPFHPHVTLFPDREGWEERVVADYLWSAGLCASGDTGVGVFIRIE